MGGVTDLEGVHGPIIALDSEWARLLDRPDFSGNLECWVRMRGGRPCSCCFSTAYGYGKGGQMCRPHSSDSGE